jgi:hypothetical protein
MSQLLMTGELSTELAQREHAARYFAIRAALRAEAKRATVVELTTVVELNRAHEADFGSLQDINLSPF